MELTYDKCTVEQAKRLKELGVKQESQFYYCPWKATDFKDVFVGQKCDKGFFHCFEGDVETFSTPPEVFAAFTTGELGEMLPHEIVSVKVGAPLSWSVNVISPLCFRMDDAPVKYKFTKFPTEAQVRADILIYLLEQKLIPSNQLRYLLPPEDMINRLGRLDHLKNPQQR